jgi:7-keto-8-aminopelargonate synthetase-like enzyme
MARLRSHLDLLARLDLLAPGHGSPIVPVVLGSEAAAAEAADRLLATGLLVPAIRPPTVPPGSSRLRISLSAAHRTADVRRLVDALATLEV